MRCDRLGGLRVGVEVLDDQKRQPGANARGAAQRRHAQRETFTEQVPDLVAPRGLITVRAVAWAIGQLHREHATIASLARCLGVSWWRLWRAVRPELERLAADESGFTGVTSLGVDEHIWHHGDRRTKGPKKLTGMVYFTRDDDGRVHARLLDLVPGRSKKAYADSLDERGQEFRKNIDVAALDPFGGYKSAIDDQLQDATAVLDAFHVVKLGTAVVNEIRRRSSRPHRAPPPQGRSRPSCAPEPSTSPTSNRPAWPEQSNPTRRTTRSSPPGRGHRTCAPPTAHPTSPRAAAGPRRPWPRSTPARSPKSHASGGPCDAGAKRSWPTSPPAERTTAAPKPSTTSSSSTAASPAATATTTTTACACCSPPEDSHHDPHRIGEEPLWCTKRHVPMLPKATHTSAGPHA